MIRSIPALRDAELVRLGYAGEYDFVQPRQLRRTLETRLADGLFMAGQINGTTRYEEAAAQGVIAGINAAQRRTRPGADHTGEVAGLYRRNA